MALEDMLNMINFLICFSNHTKEIKEVSTMKKESKLDMSDNQKLYIAYNLN